MNSNPILLIHGYSAESRNTDARSVTRIYGSLPRDLRRLYGPKSVFELDVSRYISLEGGINLNDLATALQQALENEYPHLVADRFNVIIHSTGALVIRNWIRRFSPRPCPIERLVYLAGANFGSGWAHIGKGQLAKWGRFVFQRGTERGVQVLRALELGASETLDLHRYFLYEGQQLLHDYRVREFCITGSQVLQSWVPIPVRYAHEDGSDGVVRVSGCNLNMNYVSLHPIQRTAALQWDEIEHYCKLMGTASEQRKEQPSEFYRVHEQFLIDDGDLPSIPFAIPFQCAHTGSDFGIVTGEEVRPQILSLLDAALAVTTEKQYEYTVDQFTKHTQNSYQQAVEKLQPGRIRGLLHEPRAQYDPHAQLIFRLRDQYGKPVDHFDIYFNSAGRSDFAINQLFEHCHRNTTTPGIIVFYLRIEQFNKKEKEWVNQLKWVNGVELEIAPTEPQTDEIRYLPLCLTLSSQRLQRFIQPHRTTIIDVTLLRLPSPNVFRIHNAAI